MECGPRERILYAALRAGVGVPYECATGSCGTCKARARPGTIEDIWPEAPGLAGLKRERGEFLMCQGAALGDCEILVPSRIEADTGGVRRPRHLLGTLADIRPLTRDVTAFRVTLDRTVAFDAGQFAVLAVPRTGPGIARTPWSTLPHEPTVWTSSSSTSPGAASPTGWSLTDRISHVNVEEIRERIPGSGSTAGPAPGRADNPLCGRDARAPRTAETAPGEASGALDVFGPLGKATWRPEEDQDLLCIAGGSGIAGMMSILSHAASSGHFERRRGNVFFGVRSREDVFFAGELASLVESAAGRLSVTIAFSEESTAARDPRIPRRIDVAQGFVHTVAGKRMAGA